MIWHATYCQKGFLHQCRSVVFSVVVLQHQHWFCSVSVATLEGLVTTDRSAFCKWIFKSLHFSNYLIIYALSIRLVHYIHTNRLIILIKPLFHFLRVTSNHQKLFLSLSVYYYGTRWRLKTVQKIQENWNYHTAVDIPKVSSVTTHWHYNTKKNMKLFLYIYELVA